jgi:hypothetical protein
VRDTDEIGSLTEDSAFFFWPGESFEKFYPGDFSPGQVF